MSELTSCNYCDYLRIKRREEKAGRTVTTRVESGGVRMYADGKRLGVWFMALPDHCCCG